MATWIYRKNDDGIESTLIDAKYLPDHLLNGWTVDKELLEIEAEETVISFEDVDTNNTGKLSPDEVRTAAKARGLENWDTKRIATLKKELGLNDD